jgi:hypothetical protein
VRRRDFIMLPGTAAAAWPLTARAQQAGKLPTIGYLGVTTPAVSAQRLAAFVQRLRELGWIDGRNIAIEYRWAEGSNERTAEFVAEFVRRKVDVIVTGGGPAVAAAKQATSVFGNSMGSEAHSAFLPTVGQTVSMSCSGGEPFAPFAVRECGGRAWRLRAGRIKTTPSQRASRCWPAA